MIKGSFPQDIAILNAYTSKKRKTCEAKTDRSAEVTDSSTIIVGNFNTPLSIDRTRQKINKDTEELNQEDLIDIYRTLHSTMQNTHSFQVLTE